MFEPKMLTKSCSEKHPVWHFLESSVKNRTPLARSALIQHCLANRSILVFLNDMIVKAQSTGDSSDCSKTLIAFYTATAVQVLAAAPKVTDELISAMLPSILKGLRSMEIPDLRVCCIAFCCSEFPGNSFRS